MNMLRFATIVDFHLTRVFDMIPVKRHLQVANPCFIVGANMKKTLHDL